MRTTSLFLLISVISLNTAFAQQTQVSSDSQTIESSYLILPRIEVVPIKDTKADRQYELYIKLPEAYSENEDTQYPVLYFTDAIWHVEILSSSTEFLMENTILVGISWQKDIAEDLKKEQGEHVSRYRDYSVSPSGNTENQEKYKFGQADTHLDFIRNDVINYVESNYRTDPDRRSYFGYSLGGLFGCYVLLAQPDTFKNYILGSPSLWRDNPLLSELASEEGLNANVFVSHGDEEKELGPHIEEFVALLKNREDESLSLQQVMINGSHQTAFPMTSVRGVTWLSEVIEE